MDMKAYSFFKLLNNKIRKYDKAASNPFKSAQVPITLIWIEDNKEFNNYKF